MEFLITYSIGSEITVRESTQVAETKDRAISKLMRFYPGPITIHSCEEKAMKVIEGEVEINPWGNWSDVDKGLYVGGECFAFDSGGGLGYTPLNEYEGKRVRITIEVLPDEESDDE